MHIRSRWLPAAVLATCASVACSSGSGRRTVQVVAATPPASQTAAAAPAPPAVDPVQDLLAIADRHFEAGRAELSLGHLSRAKTRFNQALDVLLESSQGARVDPR